MGKSRDAFRTISEVAEWLDTQAHVLRFWESKFPQVKPVKRAGGRRYYRPQDMLLLGGIKKLLHDDGLTIKGAQKLLREKGVKYVSGLSQPLESEEENTDTIDAVAEQVIPTPDPVKQVVEAEDYLPEDDSPPEEDDYLPEAVAVASESDDLPETLDPIEDLATEDDEEDMQEDEDIAVQAAPVDAPKPSGISDLFTHAQDTPESGAPDGSDDDDLSPSQDTIPAFINRVSEQAEVEADQADEPTKTAADPETTAPGPTKVAEDDMLNEASDDAKRPVSAQNEFSRDAFMIELSRTDGIAAKDRARAAELVAQLEALRARAAETESA